MNIANEREMDHLALCLTADTNEAHITTDALVDCAATLRKLSDNAAVHWLGCFSQPTRDRLLRILAAN